MEFQGVNFKAEISPDNPNKCLVEYTAFGEVATGVSFTFPDYIKHRFHVGDRLVLPTAMIKKYIKEKKELKVVLTEVVIDCDDNVYLENCALSHVKLNGDINISDSVIRGSTDPNDYGVRELDLNSYITDSNIKDCLVFAKFMNINESDINNVVLKAYNLLVDNSNIAGGSIHGMQTAHMTNSNIKSCVLRRNFKVTNSKLENISFDLYRSCLHALDSTIIFEALTSMRSTMVPHFTFTNTDIRNIEDIQFSRSGEQFTQTEKDFLRLINFVPSRTTSFSIETMTEEKYKMYKSQIDIRAISSYEKFTAPNRLKLLKILVKHRLISKVRAQALLKAYNYTDILSKDWEQISLEEFQKTSSPWKYLDPNKMIRANYYKRWLTDTDFENLEKHKHNSYVWSPYLGVYILNVRTCHSFTPDFGMLFEYTDSNQETEYWFEYRKFFYVEYNLVTNTFTEDMNGEDDYDDEVVIDCDDETYNYETDNYLSAMRTGTYWWENWDRVNTNINGIKLLYIGDSYPEYTTFNGSILECADYSNIIKSYHSTEKNKFVGVGDYFLGVELEMEMNDYGKKNLVYKELHRLLHTNKNFVLERDGSLNYGFELITQPHTYEKLLKTLKVVEEIPNVSAKSSRCGMHVHISKSAFKEELEQGTLILICMHLQNYFKKFSERKSYDFCRLYLRGATFSDIDSWNKVFSNRSERRMFVNLTNDNTVEFRIFQGSTDYKNIVANVQMVIILQKLVRNILLELGIDFNTSKTTENFERIKERVLKLDRTDLINIAESQDFSEFIEKNAKIKK